MSSDVRPRKTGIIVFSARILSVFTGSFFLLMLTRSLATTQFGLWEFITDVVVFASYPTGLLTYWATREVARGKVVGKTTLVLNLLASTIGMGIFLAFALLSYSSIHQELTPFLFSLVLVPLSYWNQATLALVGGYNPAIGAYSLLVSEPAKLIVAFPLLFVFNLGIYGVIVAIAVSFLVQNVAATVQLSKVTTDKVDLSLGKKWLSQPHVPALAGLVAAMGVADTFAASIGQGSTLLAGYYQAAFQVATLVGYSLYLSSALYPLLLRRSETEPSDLFKTSLEFTLLFAVPMAAGSIALASKILYLLSPRYVVSATALIILSLAAVSSSISWVVDQGLMGRETADIEEGNRTKRILSSDLAFVSLANLAYSAVYVSSVFVIGRFTPVTASGIGRFVDYWATSQLVFNAVLVAGKSLRLARRMKVRISRSILSYIGAGTAMGVLVYLLSASLLPTTLTNLDFSLRLGGLVGIGAVFYFGLLLLADEDVRAMARTIL
ncbi:MAG TPA: hypothetical protein VEJ36_08155 [Nitrososphaerales archaeon]|nr:hypothetical protein [Nitrososphaerales archaeon]